MLRVALLSILLSVLIAAPAQAAPAITVNPDTSNGVISATVGDSSPLVQAEVDVRPVGQQDFLQVPSSINGQLISADTRAVVLSPGTYEVLVIATNAAGEQRASGLSAEGQPVLLTVRAGTPTPAPVPTPAPSASPRPASATQVTIAGGARPGAVLSGVVRVAGRATSGMPVVVEQQVSGRSGFSTLVETTSTADGRWSVRVPTSAPSGRLRARVLATTTLRASTSKSTSTRATARVSLRVSRRTLRLGQLLRFSGQVLSSPRPSGMRVRLQARDRGRWVTFARPKVGGDGRFTSSYRFKRSVGTVRYPFRAVVDARAGLPFAQGLSSAQKVTVVGR